MSLSRAAAAFICSALLGCAQPDTTLFHPHHVDMSSPFGPPPDLAHAPVDAAAISDLAMTAKDLAPPRPTVAPHDIDTASGGALGALTERPTVAPHDIDTASGGALGKGAKVALTGMVAVTPVDSFTSSGGTKCNYQVWVQDPTCTAPPCGLVVQVLGVQKTGAYCPYPDQSGTLLAAVKPGDNLDVNGTIDLFTETGATDGGVAGTITQHIVVADSVKVTLGTAKIDPKTFTVADGTLFVTFAGAGWATYEGTYVRLQPASKLTIAEIDASKPYHFRTAPGSTDFGTSFRHTYNPGVGAPAFPTTGVQFTAICGVVTATFGGAIVPTQPSDFVP
jgi:hypothetical protein